MIIKHEMLVMLRVIDLLFAIGSIYYWHKFWRVANGKSVVWLLSVSVYSAFLLLCLCFAKPTLYLFKIPVSLWLTPIFIGMLFGSKELSNELNKYINRKKRK